MDISALLAAAVVVATAGGSWFQGRKNGLSNALTTASDVVGMLAAQVGELRILLSQREAELDHLRQRLAALEGHPADNE